MTDTPSYPALIELITRLDGKDKKTCELALYCLNKQDKRDIKLQARISELEADVARYKAIASKAIREQVGIRLQVISECALVAESQTCCVQETDDYYSGYCDGVMEAAKAVRELICSTS